MARLTGEANEYTPEMVDFSCSGSALSSVKPRRTGSSMSASVKAGTSTSPSRPDTEDIEIATSSLECHDGDLEVPPLTDADMQDPVLLREMAALGWTEDSVDGEHEGCLSNGGDAMQLQVLPSQEFGQPRESNDVAVFLQRTADLRGTSGQLPAAEAATAGAKPGRLNDHLEMGNLSTSDRYSVLPSPSVPLSTLPAPLHGAKAQLGTRPSSGRIVDRVAALRLEAKTLHMAGDTAGAINCLREAKMVEASGRPSPSPVAVEKVAARVGAEKTALTRPLVEDYVQTQVTAQAHVQSQTQAHKQAQKPAKTHVELQTQMLAQRQARAPVLQQMSEAEIEAARRAAWDAAEASIIEAAKLSAIEGQRLLLNGDRDGALQCAREVRLEYLG